MPPHFILLTTLQILWMSKNNVKVLLVIIKVKVTVKIKF